MLAERAARTAARNRGLALGSGKPERAAVVSSRMILVKTLARFLSCAPFRYMMFLNCEWPAISAALLQARANKAIWQDCGESGANAASSGSSPQPIASPFMEAAPARRAGRRPAPARCGGPALSCHRLPQRRRTGLLRLRQALVSRSA